MKGDFFLCTYKWTYRDNYGTFICVVLGDLAAKGGGGKGERKNSNLNGGLGIGGHVDRGIVAHLPTSSTRVLICSTDNKTSSTSGCTA